MSRCSEPWGMPRRGALSVASARNVLKNCPAARRWSLTLRARWRILLCMRLHVRFSTVEDGNERAQATARGVSGRSRRALAARLLFHPPPEPRL